MKTAVTILLVIAMTSCLDDKYVESDFFYLVNKKAKMPIMVRGNKASQVFILFVHGGPGGTSIQKIGLKAFDILESRYAMVYWDQRASGSSQGNSEDALLTLDQFVEDLDKVIILLKQRYNNPSIVLMGHSWGGGLGTAYLGDPVRQSKVKAWIEVDGAHNNPLADELSLQLMRTYAAQRVAEGTEVEFWQYALQWYTDNPNFTSNQLEHYSFLEKAHGYIHEASLKRDTRTFPEYSFSYLFNSPADVLAALTNYRHVIQEFIVSDIDLTPRMNNITIPALIVWGRHDGVIPYPMAQQALDALGSADKSILTLNNSAHFGYYEEPDAFAEGVTWFVERIK